ncbi:DUF736 domain-containing protein [Chelativorans xinjiangense]|uniref:DUF736 domain-containing protein n=1 Tax=Chelativorans xinjiangense TaxID=2681485 RepID=UPI0013587525|nr:DUF736 family protein [Chelativorans xinjiangense]
MQIGHFTLAKDGGWTGAIRTLTIDAKVRLVPNDDRNSDNAPAFRVLVGSARIGDAWDARSSGDNPRYYLRLHLDDPSLPAPHTAALFLSDEADKARLVWNRRRKQ